LTLGIFIFFTSDQENQSLNWSWDYFLWSTKRVSRNWTRPKSVEKKRDWLVGLAHMVKKINQLL